VRAKSSFHYFGYTDAIYEQFEATARMRKICIASIPKSRDCFISPAIRTPRQPPQPNRNESDPSQFGQINSVLPIRLFTLRPYLGESMQDKFEIGTSFLEPTLVHDNCIIRLHRIIQRDRRFNNAPVIKSPLDFQAPI